MHQGKALRGWLNIHETLLPCGEAAVAVEVSRVADLIRVCKTDTPQGRKMFAEMLELAADKTPAEILQDGLKVPSSVKEAYPQMYHYADADTFLHHATARADGSWMLEPKDSRYLSIEEFASQQSSKEALQLPRPNTPEPGGLVDTTKGRFELCVQTVDVADDLRVPPGYTHSVTEGVWCKRAWLEPLTRDNPHRGFGDAGQMIQSKAVGGVLVDKQSGQVIHTMAELEAALNNP